MTGGQKSNQLGAVWLGSAVFGVSLFLNGDAPKYLTLDAKAGEPPPLNPDALMIQLPQPSFAALPQPALPAAPAAAAPHPQHRRDLRGSPYRAESANPAKHALAFTPRVLDEPGLPSALAANGIPNVPAKHVARRVISDPGTGTGYSSNTLAPSPQRTAPLPGPISRDATAQFEHQSTLTDEPASPAEQQAKNRAHRPSLETGGNDFGKGPAQAPPKISLVKDRMVVAATLAANLASVSARIGAAKIPSTQATTTQGSDIPQPAFGSPPPPEQQIIATKAASQPLSGFAVEPPAAVKPAAKLQSSADAYLIYDDENTRAQSAQPQIGPQSAVAPVPPALPLALPIQASGTAPILSYNDELILEIRVAKIATSDTLIAYGTRAGVYLPVGETSRYLDLAIVVSDEGHYASGWFLSEERRLTIDLRQNLLTINGQTMPLDPADAAAFEGEMYLRTDQFTELLPVKMTANLRNQSVMIETLEPFPFEERITRENERRKLNSKQDTQTQRRWPREETPWRAFTIPAGDLEVRAVADSTRGQRLEGDLLLAGDLGFMTGQTFIAGTSDEGLTSAHLELGRRDPDADLLGPMRATEFQLGDVGTASMPLGLRGTAGRGFSLSNTPFENVSVFDKIDLRGHLPEGYEVELYRNDILIASTRDGINGQYEFLQVPVDYGLNIFRLVSFGPQGQRREEVRRISVGDGRLSRGQFVYQFGMVQKDVNLLGVRGPSFSRTRDYGGWRSNLQLAYGLSSDITAMLGGAWFETDTGQRWLAYSGLRSGIGGLALKADLGISAGAQSAGLGLGGRFLGSSFTLSHYEYGGNFVDEVRGVGSEYLNRATEFDVNTSLHLGGEHSMMMPLAARVKRIEYADARTRTSADLRASTRFPGWMISNRLEYSNISTPGGPSQSQLLGNFDIASISTKRLKGRAALGYQMLPNASLDLAAIELDYTLDSQTLLHASAAYGFKQSDLHLGLSAVRQLDKFTVAFDGSYGLAQNNYSLGLRLGFSFGRDPLSGRFFMGEPGKATSGAIALRAFQDMDGDNRFGGNDVLLPGVAFASPFAEGTTNEQGQARLTGLGSGNRASIQVDPSSLPDILMAPVSRGIEIVPRPGRFHTTDFPIVGLSEIEGTAYFINGNTRRGVAGVRMHLVKRNAEEVKYLRTEVDGYFFYEEVFPGEYQIVLDQEQSTRLNICMADTKPIIVGPVADIHTLDIILRPCDD